ncbi:hypothetical protein DITRI_Ditri12bG0168300 [Diplodiscus trichospermus]
MESSVTIEEECTTPKHRIPEVFQCPQPPRKKPPGGAKRQPPKNGYFQPPDLDVLFSSVYPHGWFLYSPIVTIDVE